jgi:hypothetical protein
VIGRGPGNEDYRLVDAAMRTLGSDDAPSPSPLPDPAFIWWKAQLLRRLDAEQGALAPIEVGDRVHFGVAVIVAVVLAALAWTRVPFTDADPMALPTVGIALAVLILTIGGTVWSEITGG